MSRRTSGADQYDGCGRRFLNEPVYSYALWKFPPAVIPPDQLRVELGTGNAHQGDTIRRVTLVASALCSRRRS